MGAGGGGRGGGTQGHTRAGAQGQLKRGPPWTLGSQASPGQPQRGGGHSPASSADSFIKKGKKLNRAEKKQHLDTGQLSGPLFRIQKENKPWAGLTRKIRAMGFSVESLSNAFSLPEVGYFCWH